MANSTTSGVRSPVRIPGGESTRLPQSHAATRQARERPPGAHDDRRESRADDVRPAKEGRELDRRKRQLRPGEGRKGISAAPGAGPSRASHFGWQSRLPERLAAAWFPGFSDAGGARDSADNRTARTMAELTNDIHFLEHSRLGIPVIFHEECLHRHAAIGGTRAVHPKAAAGVGEDFHILKHPKPRNSCTPNQIPCQGWKWNPNLACPRAPRCAGLAFSAAMQV